MNFFFKAHVFIAQLVKLLPLPVPVSLLSSSVSAGTVDAALSSSCAYSLTSV